VTKKPHKAFGVSPTVRKTSVIEAIPTSFNDEHPSWRVSRLEFVDPFGWHDVDALKIREIRQKLANFESMTWNDILIKAKKQNHSVPLSRLCKEAQDRLIEMRLDNLDELVSLHLSGIERVWGFRMHAVFHVLWWDPHHRVCPSLLKHT
jgi:hypothetical protein